MTTTVAVISKQTLSDGAIAVTFRANNDPTSDSVSTFYVTAATVQADVDAWVATEKQRVSDQYDAVQNANTSLLGMIT